jgi:AAA15 family ATPase/GTPase
LHPLIIEGIIKLFNSPIKNPRNAQLVISCHAVNILTNKLFRRDQIWFCEKDQYGATDLYSLVEYDGPIRKDAALKLHILFEGFIDNRRNGKFRNLHRRQCFEGIICVLAVMQRKKQARRTP